MLVKGMLVIILNFHEYTGCIGTYKNQIDGLALLTVVYCPNGGKYDYIAGIPISIMEEYSSGNNSWRRPGHRKQQ